MNPDITVRNVVVSADLGHRLDLDMVANLDGTSYEPRRFPCAVIRQKNPKSTVLVFGSGKVVCVGSPSGELAAAALFRALSRMRSSGIDTGDDPAPKVRNVVATADLHCRIRIDGASRKLSRTVYEPEMFPGVIHRMLDPRAVILLFASGKVVCVGARTEDEARRAIRVTRSTLSRLGLIRDPDG